MARTRKDKSKRKRAPKAAPKLLGLEQSKSAVLGCLTSLSFQRSNDPAIREFIDWYRSKPRPTFKKTVVTGYRISLRQRYCASSTINLRLAATRRLACEASDCALRSSYSVAGTRRESILSRLITASAIVRFCKQKMIWLGHLTKD